MGSFQKTRSTQRSGSVIAERIEQVKNKFELELLELLDRFLDGCGNYTSTLVTSKIESL